MTPFVTRVTELLEAQRVDIIEISAEKCEYRILGIASTAEKIEEAAGELGAAPGWNDAIEAAAKRAALFFDGVSFPNECCPNRESCSCEDRLPLRIADAVRSLRRPDAGPARERPSASKTSQAILDRWNALDKLSYEQLRAQLIALLEGK